MYSALASDHFHHPRRVGPLDAATHQGTGGVPGEGPYLILWFVVEGNRIERAAYRTFGCPAAIASASMMAELCEGRSIEQALRLSEAELVEALGGLPEGKEHCPKLALKALQEAFTT